MSVRVMSWVFHHSRATGSDRLVLLAIADSANDHGSEAWPSIGRIAAKAGVDRRTVTRSLGRLIDMGELEKVRHGGLTARGGVSNSYRITMPDYAKQGPSAPRGEMPPPGATCPEVGATTTERGGEVPPNPSRDTRNHPRPDADSALVADFAANADQVRSLKARRSTASNPAGESGPAHDDAEVAG